MQQRYTSYSGIRSHVTMPSQGQPLGTASFLPLNQGSRQAHPSVALQNTKSHLVEFSELAELIPEVPLLASATEVSHPHLGSGHVSHIILGCSTEARKCRSRGEMVEGSDASAHT